MGALMTARDDVQPCDIGFECGGQGVGQSKTIALTEALSDAKDTARIICESNSGCPAAKFIRYVSVDFTRENINFRAHIAAEFQCKATS